MACAQRHLTAKPMKTRQLRMRLLLFVVAATAVALAAFVATPAASNLWSLATARGCFIPRESSIWSFRVTKENNGSGEWWLYGMDGTHFFALHPTDAVFLSVLVFFLLCCV